MSFFNSKWCFTSSPILSLFIRKNRRFPFLFRLLSHKLSEIMRKGVTNLLSQLNQKVETSQTRVIFLRPGETAVRSCSPFPVRTVVFFIRRGDVLVVNCRRSNRRFVFVCGRPRRGRVRVVSVSRRTRIRVRCVR